MQSSDTVGCLSMLHIPFPLLEIYLVKHCLSYVCRLREYNFLLVFPLAAIAEAYLTIIWLVLDIMFYIFINEIVLINCSMSNSSSALIVLSFSSNCAIDF